MRSYDIFGELLAAKDMEVKMLNRLTSILAYIGDNSISRLQLEDRCNFRNSLEYFSCIYAVFLANFISRADVSLWHNDTMYGSLRGDVHKCVAVFVLIYLGRGNISLDYTTKQTIHIFLPFECF